MASLRQLEDAVENAFITQLSANAEVIAQGWTVRHWQDASNQKNQKSIVVYCSGMANTAVDRTRQGELYEGSVELGAMVHAPADKNRAICKNMLGAIRDTLSSSTLETDLSDANNVFKAVLVESALNEAERDNYIQMSITCTVHLNYVPST